ncbi:hypothetical protein EW026_g1239 [Hermanssonia centrifuga]|uniref:Uncharacterized protein n=1 Tax=Hermanssonia centrifuga TaxID=98765 RepID=A0A4S4KS43_9APHY|nr:hypothetical protein EW026_g1239 [Hermanssonia centrifuga]
MSNPTGVPPPVPSMAEIPLPPGMSLPEYLTLQGQLVTIAICVAVAMGIVGWDYMVLLPEEITLYKSRDLKLWRSPTTWLFIILRYSAFLAVIPSLFFTSVQNEHCQAAVVLSTLGGVLVVASSGLIFCYRVCAIWSEDRIVYGIVSFFYIAMLGCWIAVAVHYKAVTGPATPFGSNCQMDPIISWAPISYASSVAFDTVILVLTLAKDNLRYFMLATATNIAVLSIQALGAEHDMIKPAAVPFSTVMTVAMGSRVYLNLKLYDYDHNHERGSRSTDIPLSVTSGYSESTGERTFQSIPTSVMNSTAYCSTLTKEDKTVHPYSYTGYYR